MRQIKPWIVYGIPSIVNYFINGLELFPNAGGRAVIALAEHGRWAFEE
jgi:hypothetical protein